MNQLMTKVAVAMQELSVYQIMRIGTSYQSPSPMVFQNLEWRRG